jgi:hypothetical protein
MPLITPAEVEENKALVNQERLLSASDWEGLGIPKERAEKMISMERFARLPLVNMVHVTHGGMLKAFEGLNAVYEKYMTKLLDGTLPQEFDKEGNSRDTQRDWLYAMVAASAEIRQIKAQVDRSNLLMLKAAQLVAEQGKKAGRKKPAWSSRPVNVTATPPA